MLAVIAQQFRRHAAELRVEEQIEEERGHQIVAMVAQRDLGEAFRLSEDGRHGLWPGELELSGDFFAETLDYAVALDPAAVYALRGSALALVWSRKWRRNWL